MNYLSPKLLTILAIQLGAELCILSFACEPAMAQPAGLVAAYSFDEGSGAVVADSSGNNNSSAIVGASWTGQGKYGNALSFDGADDMIVFSDSNSLDLTSAMTLEAWVHPTAPSGQRAVIFKAATDTGGLVYALYANHNAGRPEAHVGSTSIQGSAALPLNTWTHLATTYDGATFRLYVNGVQAGSLSLSTPISTSDRAFRIGGNWSQEWFQGRIDEVRVYNGALTSEEIQTDMNTPISGTPSTSSCDLNQDGTVNVSDVQLSVNMALGTTPCTANIVGPNVCDIVVVQRIVNSALGAPCVTDTTPPPPPPIEHSASLTWTASISANVAGHNVYRGTTSGGPYPTKMNSSLIAAINYTDSTVQAGQTYYYVVTAVDNTNADSAHSNEAIAVIPSP